MMRSLSFNSLSPAGQLLAAGDYGGEALRGQASEETEELKKRRQQAAQAAGYSPAGIQLSGIGLLGA